VFEEWLQLQNWEPGTAAGYKTMHEERPHDLRSTPVLELTRGRAHRLRPQRRDHEPHESWRPARPLRRGSKRVGEGIPAGLITELRDATIAAHKKANSRKFIREPAGLAEFRRAPETMEGLTPIQEEARATALLAFYCPLRPENPIRAYSPGLLWTWVDLAASTIRIPGEHMKVVASEPFELAIPASALEMLKTRRAQARRSGISPCRGNTQGTPGAGVLPLEPADHVGALPQSARPGVR
jgi:hypothetical protein